MGRVLAVAWERPGALEGRDTVPIFTTEEDSVIRDKNVLLLPENRIEGKLEIYGLTPNRTLFLFRTHLSHSNLSILPTHHTPNIYTGAHFGRPAISGRICSSIGQQVVA